MHAPRYSTSTAGPAARPTHNHRAMDAQEFESGKVCFSLTRFWDSPVSHLDEWDTRYPYSQITCRICRPDSRESALIGMTNKPKPRALDCRSSTDCTATTVIRPDREQHAFYNGMTVLRQWYTKYGRATLVHGLVTFDKSCVRFSRSWIHNLVEQLPVPSNGERRGCAHPVYLASSPCPSSGVQRPRSLGLDPTERLGRCTLVRERFRPRTVDRQGGRDLPGGTLGVDKRSIPMALGRYTRDTSLRRACMPARSASRDVLHHRPSGSRLYISGLQ